MANKRKKGQCMDFAVGGLKKLAYDEKVNATIRLRALELMLKLDGVHPEGSQADSGQPAPPAPPATPEVTTDSLLQALRDKHAGGAL